MRRLTLLLLTLATTQAGAANMPGTDRITYFGYEDCILLETPTPASSSPHRPAVFSNTRAKAPTPSTSTRHKKARL